jgi:hypothetical protein
MLDWEEVTTAAIYAVFAALSLAAFYWLMGDDADVFVDYVLVGGGVLGIIVVCYVIRGLLRALGGLFAAEEKK